MPPSKQTTFKDFKKVFIKTYLNYLYINIFSIPFFSFSLRKEKKQNRICILSWFCILTQSVDTYAYVYTKSIAYLCTRIIYIYIVKTNTSLGIWHKITILQ